MSLKTILKNFLNHVDTLEAQRKLGNDLYEIDFQKLKALTEQLKQDKDYATKEGLKDVNRRKNRYKDILPYDYTRVILSDYPGVPGSDYINANYIKGASGSLAYIASQGPLPNTVVDFWRMIWECEVQVIVMACNEQESGKYKCECYWPGEEEKKQYGNINVEMVKWRQVCPDFLVRTLKACYEDEKRVLCQFHYTTWPDHGVPNSVQPILELVQLIRDCQPSEAVPVLVHCSAGCGRTGTICAIDYVWGLMRMGKLTKNFNLFNVISDMRRQRIAMVQTKEQYVLVHKAVSSLFEQQLRVIDNHTYENLDEDGEPLILKELPLEESLYEDILDPQLFDKSYRTVDNPFENDRLPSRHEYGSMETVDSDCVQLGPKYEILDKSPSTGKKHTNLNLSKLFGNKTEHDLSSIIDLSLITQHASTVSEQLSGVTGNKKDCGAIQSARNSSTLLKLRREESVKRLISGWDKASQNLEAPKTLAKANQRHKTDSAGMGSFEKNDNQDNNEEHHKTVKTKESVPKSDSSIEKYVLALCKSSAEMSSESKQHHKLELSSTKDTHSGEIESMGKHSSSEESQHSGKLVGKATVIRRPSIAKLKALFEKSPASDYEHSSEDSSRRRRPLFRSHSHYVGHSRTFSVPDSNQSSVFTSTNSSMPNNAVHHSSGGDLVNASRNASQAHSNVGPTPASEYNLQNNAARRAPSPDKLMYRNYSDVFTNANKDGSIPQNELYLKIEQEATMADYINNYSNTLESDTYLSHETEKDSTNFPFSYENCAFSSEKIMNKKEFSLSSDKDSQSLAPVHLRIKQYITCSFQEKPPNLPMKKRSNIKEPTAVVNTIFPESSSQFVSTNFMIDENNKQKLVASKSEDYLTTPKTVFQSDNYQNVEEYQEICDEKLNAKRCLSSSFQETAVASNSPKDVQGKNNTIKETNVYSKKKEAVLKPDDNSFLFSESSKERFDKAGDSNVRSNSSGKLVSHSGNSNALKDIKYVSTPFQKNLQQLEDKLKKFDDTQKIYEQRFFFLSTNHPVKLQKPMEIKELKSPEKQDANNFVPKFNENQIQAPHKNLVGSKNKKTNISNQDTNPKNLLLHSPPPKSKRNHTSKNSSQQCQMESEPLMKSSDCMKKEISTALNSDSQKTSTHPCISKSVDSDKRPRILPLNATSPANRSDPRYFPVTRQTAEDARYASERHKAIEIKKAATQKYENHHNIYGYISSTSSDTKSNVHSSSHSKPLISDIKDIQTDAQKPTHSYMKYAGNSCQPVQGEEIYGVHRPVSGYVSAPVSGESSVAIKESYDKINPQPLYSTMYAQCPNIPVPPSSSCLGSLQHTTANVYPPGPPKPPRTFNHKYNPLFNEPESFSQPEKNKSGLGQEGGRYIVSVASPKQSENKEQDANGRQTSLYQYIPKVPNRPDRPYDGQHQSQIYGVTQSDFIAYPGHNYSSSSTRLPESQYSEATLVRSVQDPNIDHMYSTLRERPNLRNEPLYGEIKNKNRHSDYENMHDNSRQHADIVSSNLRQGMEPYYHQNYNPDPTHSLQYSQSDVGLYTVLQNPISPPEQQSSYEIESREADMTNVPKRVYFDTLQRRHKQQVSWEQRRSHDDMDIRPAPSARLKEQIHARRSMVELDNLEISVASDNGFYDQLAPHLTLHRQDFSQDSSNCNGRSSHKRTPIELSDSLLTKEVQPHKNHTNSKENASFSGTLYKAFGKLTSLTKFSKEPLNRNPSEDLRVKASCSGAKEEKKHTSFPHWSPRKASEQQQESSEQWTEV